MRRGNIHRIILIVLILIGLMSGFVLAKFNQDIRNEAKTPDTIGQVEVSVKKSPSDALRNNVVISFNTGKNASNTEAISVIGFRIKLPKTYKVVNEKGEEVKEIIPNMSLDSSWEFPINSITANDKEKIIDFSAVNTTKQGYASLETTKIAEFTVETESPEKELSLIFVPDYALMYSKDRPVTDIWTNDMPSVYQVLLK